MCCHELFEFRGQSILLMDTCDMHAVLTFKCVGKKFGGWSFTWNLCKKTFCVLQSVFHNLHNKMRDLSRLLLLQSPGKDYSIWILTAELEGARFPSGLMTAIGLSDWPIKWLVAARAATACWFIAFNVGWFALVAAIAKSPAVDGEPCALRYSLSCLFCFCWMK